MTLAGNNVDAMSKGSCASWGGEATQRGKIKFAVFPLIIWAEMQLVL